MTEESIAIQLTGHEHEIGSLRHRMKHVESQVEAINKLTASVENLAISVQEMLRSQKEHTARITRLECHPAEEARGLRREILKAIVSTVIGALLGILLTSK